MSFRKEDLNKQIEIMLNPEKFGYKECESCDGLGGDNRRVEGVPHELCEDCGGDGVIPNPESIKTDDETIIIYDESGFSSGAGVK